LVTFKVKAIPGTINQSIKTWGASLENTEIQNNTDLLSLAQELHYGDSLHRYAWNIIPLNDSTSKVEVYITDPDHRLENRLSIPFRETNFEKRTRKTLLDFNEKLNDHIKNFRVTVIGEEELKSTYCACVKVKTSQIGKAKGMMKNFPFISTVLIENEVELNGQPFLEVTGWDRENDSLQYNFCYPVIKSEKLPQHPDLVYKQFSSRKGIKAVYNGNYITSDRAWYALLDYARKNDMATTGLPVEVFFNNPNMGSNEIEWTAEIYMPIKDE
jgi:effector-binding domain-containing protein